MENPMKFKTLLLASALLLAAPAFAADAPKQIPVAGTVHDPAQVPGGLYNLDPTHAHALFFINHLGFSEYTGGFTDISGSLVFKPTALLDSKLNVTIKTNSILVNSAALTEHLKTPDFFDAEKYPDITFVSRKLTATGVDKGQLLGDLTMHGVTKPVTLDVHFLGAGIMPMKNVETMGFIATGQLKRSDFGIVNYLPGVGDDILLDISAEFNKADTSPKDMPH
jgi:polyisoprenoid-binding protein YceI